MKNQIDKLLVVESDGVLRANLITVLEDAAYKVSTDCREGMKTVFAFESDLVILGQTRRSWTAAISDALG